MSGMDADWEEQETFQDLARKPKWGDWVSTRKKPKTSVAGPNNPKSNEEFRGKLLKVDSAVHFQTEPNSTYIYGSGYLNIETTDLEDARTRISRVKESDVILYKILTTGFRKFLVRPNSGFLRSRQYVCVHIRTAQADETAEQIEKLKFQLQALVIPSDHKILAPEAKAGDNFGEDQGIDLLREKLKNTDTLHALWDELSGIPGTYVEKHKVFVQIHPVEASNSNAGRALSDRRRRVEQTSFLQRIGTIITAILLLWVAMRLFPLETFQPLIASSHQQGDPSPSAPMTQENKVQTLGPGVSA